MSTIHFAAVRQTLRLEGGAQLLRCHMESAQGLAYEPGQYIIINSGLPNAEGKPLKRAYTLFAVNEDGTEFSLLAEKLPSAGVSVYLNEREVGDRLQFTGPWGKFKTLPETDTPVPGAVCFAFGTGINALLGLLNRNLPAPKTHLFWFRDANTAFMSDVCLRDHLPHNLHELKIEDLEAYSEERAQELLADLAWAKDHDLYLAGEGHWTDGLAEGFLALGAQPERMRREVFYRSPRQGV